MADDLSGIFTPDAKVINKIFGDADSYYQIPDYQRPYSWQDEQVEQLWDDLYSAMESNDESYFLGPVILIKNKGYYEVVDGQQRLTTLTILFCVLRDLYLQKDNRILNAVKSLVDQKYRLRLITQLHYQNQFENEILDKVNFPQTKVSKKERRENKFLNTSLIFKEKLEELDKDGKINELVEFILNKVVMITIVCSKQSFAIKLFQVLNTRGLDLSNADLIKSYLYGNLDDDIKKQQFISTWREIETLSKQMGESIEDLFTYYEYYLIARNPKFSLYEELTKSKLFKTKESNKIIHLIKQFVVSFDEVTQNWTKPIYSFYYLPNQVFWKAILTTAKRKSFEDFDELVRELRNLYYSYWIAGYTTSKIKQISFNLIKWIKEKEDLAKIKKKLAMKMSEDNVIPRMKENLQNDCYGDAWVKPLLALIEYEQTDESKYSFIELDRKLHVDHVLPQKWYINEDWKREWTKEDADEYIDRLGNLTLLSGRKNIQARHWAFEEKKKVYKGKGLDGTTGFLVTQKVIENPKWTKDEFQNRHEFLIGEIERILNVKLS